MQFCDFDAPDYISSCALESNDEIRIAELAIALVYNDHEVVSVDRHINHLQKISDEVGRRFCALLDAGGIDDSATRLAALKHVIVDIHDYQPDTKNHEILEGADMIRVIDRGRGCSAALGVLYMDAAMRKGWNIEGVNFPSRFLCRIEHEGVRIIFDPAFSCAVMEAHDLRALVKVALGEEAELSTQYLEGLDAKQSVIHLCNNIKLRRIEMGEYRKALSIVLRMLVLAPDEFRLLLDAGVLSARLNEKDQAREYLNDYIEKAPDDYDLRDALILLSDLD